MSIKVEQIYYSEQLSTNELHAHQKYTSGEIEYIIKGAEDEDKAIIAARAHTANKYKGMHLVSISISERLYDDSWRVRCSYDASVATASIDGVSLPDSSVNFDFSSTTVNIKRSIKTVASYPRVIGAATDNHYGAINVVDNGEQGKTADGVDILRPQLEFSETHYFFNASLTTKYKRILADTIGTVNNAAFRGYNAGEVLFLGVSGSRAGKAKDDLWTLDFKFAVSLNESNINISGIEGVSKKGWEYAWLYSRARVHAQEGAATNDGALYHRPESAYIEQVYPYADFGQLGIGN